MYGDKSSAIIYSIIETAKENGLIPMNYHTYLFKKISNVDFKNNLDSFKSLFPWGNLLKECYLKKKIKNKRLIAVNVTSY